MLRRRVDTRCNVNSYGGGLARVFKGFRAADCADIVPQTKVGVESQRFNVSMQSANYEDRLQSITVQQSEERCSFRAH